MTKRFEFTGFARIALTMLLVLLVAPSVYSQLGTATLSGTVADSSGAVVPNVKVTLSNTVMKYIREESTDARGMYVITAIPPGSYSLRVAAEGFQPAEKTGILLTPGQGSTLDVQLMLGTTKQEVQVTAAPPLLQTGNATLGAAVSTMAVEDLPLNERNFSEVVLTLPGIAPIQSSGRNDSFQSIGQLPAVYGQRQRNNYWTLDGVSNTDADNGTNTYPPPEAIEEIKVQSGITSALYGVGSGANVSVVTKSGTNQIHGDVWELFRNNDMNARGFFVPKLGAFHWNQFGGAVGGPVIIPHLISKEKAWYFFGYYEGIRLTTAANASATVPTAAEMQGNFAADSPIYNPYTTPASGLVSGRSLFAGNIIPTGPTTLCAPQPTCINSATMGVAKAYYPAPNLAVGIIGTSNYLNTNQNRSLDDTWQVRIDHQFNSKDSMFVRYDRTDMWNTSWSVLPYPSESGNWLHNLGASETHQFDPTFVVTARFGFDGFLRSGSYVLLPGLAQSLGFTTAFPTFAAHTGQTFTLVPPLSVSGYTGDGESVTLPAPEDDYEWSADAAKTKGRHTIQFGYWQQHFYHTSINIPSAGVSFGQLQTYNGASGTGNSFASYFLGLPNAANTTIGDSSGINVGHALGSYIQDDFRVTRRLTVNLGMRYEYYAPLPNIIGSGGFEWATGQYWWNKTNPITGAAANVSYGSIPPDYKAGFAPRFGIAYQITPKTVVRAGYGIFDNSYGFERSQGQQGNRGNWPFASPYSVSGVNAGVPNTFMPDPFPTPPTVSLTAKSFNQNLEINTPWTRLGYVYEWTLSVTRALTPTTTLEAAYFGSAGFRLDGQYLDDTAVTPGPGSISARQVYPQFAAGYVTNVNNVFHANYNAGSLNFNKRFSHGILLNANYTYSACMDVDDDAANLTGPSRVIRLLPISYYYGRCGYDIPQRLVVSYVYQVPFKTGNKFADGVVAGWALSGIASFNSGQAYAPVLSSDVANVGTGNEFVEVVGKPKLSSPTHAEWFNTAAFALPAAYTWGNSGRSTLRAEAMKNWNFSLMKQFHFKEKNYVEIRVSAYNFTNDVIFGVPGETIGTSSFGVVGGQSNPARDVELQAKIHF